jgi:hypothetical protein
MSIIGTEARTDVYEVFAQALIARSNSNNFNEALREWKLVDEGRDLLPGEKGLKCICGTPELQTIYTFTHITHDRQIIVGSTCVTHFPADLERDGEDVARNNPHKWTRSGYLLDDTVCPDDEVEFSPDAEEYAEEEEEASEIDYDSESSYHPSESESESESGEEQPDIDMKKYQDYDALVEGIRNNANKNKIKAQQKTARDLSNPHIDKHTMIRNQARQALYESKEEQIPKKQTKHTNHSNNSNRTNRTVGTCYGQRRGAIYFASLASIARADIRAATGAGIRVLFDQSVSGSYIIIRGFDEDNQNKIGIIPWSTVFSGTYTKQKSFKKLFTQRIINVKNGPKYHKLSTLNNVQSDILFYILSDINNTELKTFLTNSDADFYGNRPINIARCCVYAPTDYIKELFCKKFPFDITLSTAVASVTSAVSTSASAPPQTPVVSTTSALLPPPPPPQDDNDDNDMMDIHPPPPPMHTQTTTTKQSFKPVQLLTRFNEEKVDDDHNEELIIKRRRLKKDVLHLRTTMIIIVLIAVLLATSLIVFLLTRLIHQKTK